MEVTQMHYVEKVLKKSNAFDDLPAKTPFGDSLDLVRLYVTNCTRLIGHTQSIR